MSSQTLPAISSIASLSTEQRAQILDLLFEPCTQLHTLSVSSLHEQTFKSYSALIEGVRVQLYQLYQSDLESDAKWLDAILSAHPRLGEKKVESELSKKEQAAMNQASGNDHDPEKLKELNAKYEGTFPGLRYVVFVNGRSRPIIMEDMQRRIDRNNIQQEKIDAIDAMCEIARDRAGKLGAE